MKRDLSTTNGLTKRQSAGIGEIRNMEQVNAAALREIFGAGLVAEPLVVPLPVQRQAPDQSFNILLVGVEASSASIAWNSLKGVCNDRGLSCRWVFDFKDALSIVRRDSFELILCDLQSRANTIERINLLRQAGGNIPIVMLTDTDCPETLQRLREFGVEDLLSRSNISLAALQRIICRAIERRNFKIQIDLTLRRERLRGEMLARIANNAPLREILSELGQALRRDASCDDCGFAIDLDDGSGSRLLWPNEGCVSAQLANQALSHGLLAPIRPDSDPDCSVCLQCIRSGSRLLGQLAMVPGTSAATQEMLRSYAALGAELIALAIDRQRTMENLCKSQAELRQLSIQLLGVQEAERQRIAGDLHDVIGQSLSVVKFSMEEAEQQFRSLGSPEAAAILSGLVPWVKHALDEVRRISMDLRPAIIDDLGILPTLSWFFREFESAQRSLRIDQQIGITEADIPDHLKIVIFRILQEAMSNIVKHAEATRVVFFLERIGGNLRLAIDDNGIGFDCLQANQSSDHRSGLGLTSMRERARATGGSFTLESSPGVGTRILVGWHFPE